jgi:hypothetical protein
MAQTNFNRQMNQLKYRVRITPGYKYSQLQGFVLFSISSLKVLLFPLINL